MITIIKSFTKQEPGIVLDTWDALTHLILTISYQIQLLFPVL